MGGWTRLWLALSVPWVLFFGWLSFALDPTTDAALILGRFLLVIGPPLLLYAAGLTLRWIVRGFIEAGQSYTP